MRFLALFFLICLSFSGNAIVVDGKTVYGYVEKVTLSDPDLTISAKLDTGAKTASLSAIKITETTVGDKTYLTFFVPTKKGRVPFSCEYAGRVKIKSRVGETKIHSMLKTSIRRPVVIMKMMLDGKERNIRVNLTNRKRFIYPLLLGREAIIEFGGIVDPNLRYTLKNKQMDKSTDKQ